MDFIFEIDPVAKPRMSQRDKFAPSKAARKYFKFASKLRAMAGLKRYQITLPLSITFIAPMPKSWSEKKKKRLNGELKPTKPDLDNYIKAFKDALAKNDEWVSHYGDMKKIYGYTGKIIIHVKENV